MAKYFLTNRAIDNIESIAAYLADQSPSRADRVIDQLYSRFEDIAANPGGYVKTPEFGPDLRRCVQKPYLIFFQETPKGIRIVTVVHGARQLPNYFGIVSDGQPS